jgi:hypothetical protein
LFAKADVRAALADEPEHFRPQVSFVGVAFLLTRRRVRLAGTASGPDGPIVGPSGKPQGERPSANAGKEVALNKSSKVIWLDFPDVSFINYAFRNQVCIHQIPQPLRRVRVKFGVVVH